MLEELRRMLNALVSGTVMSGHRYKRFSETTFCIRGQFEENIYDDEGSRRFLVELYRLWNSLK